MVRCNEVGLVVVVMLSLLLGAACGCRDGVTRSPGASSQRGESRDDRVGRKAAAGRSADRSGTDQSARGAAEDRLASLPPPLEPALLDAGWIRLFDGQTLFGWERLGRASWRVEGGSIVGDGKAPGFLRTTTPFADFELHVEYRGAADANSGIFVRTTRDPKSPESDAFEINIAPASNRFPTGSVVAHRRSDDGAVRRALHPDTWQTMAITANGSALSVRLNGQLVLEWDEATVRRHGYIALQHNRGTIRFRNIRLRPLGMTPLFDGKTLAGWKTHPKLGGRFSVTSEGAIRVEGGRGQLETERVFGDFVLSLQCKTCKRGLNSGVFFRCIPGDVMMGYESQIEHRYDDGDRTRPSDGGTGGIFRRQPARIVASDDLAWFDKTIVASGPHIAVWVNGLQVTDWTDRRPPNPNPRRGRRTEPGSIMLQAHDPTTDVLFRHLRIASWDHFKDAADNP